MANHNILGALGEDLAVSFLLKNGHQILERNFRFERTEIDIISKKGNLIIFTEVKTLASNKYAYPEAAVTLSKQLKIARVAAHFLRFKGLDNAIRFDIIAITRGEPIYHIPDAFYPET